MEELQKLYNALSNDYDLGDFNSFASRMQTPEQRKRFYDAISNEGLDLGDYNEYENRLKKKDTVVDGTSPMEPMDSTLPQAEADTLLVSEEPQEPSSPIDAIINSFTVDLENLSPEELAPFKADESLRERAAIFGSESSFFNELSDEVAQSKYIQSRAEETAKDIEDFYADKINSELNANPEYAKEIKNIQKKYYDVIEQKTRELRSKVFNKEISSKEANDFLRKMNESAEESIALEKYTNPITSKLLDETLKKYEEEWKGSLDKLNARTEALVEQIDANSFWKPLRNVVLNNLYGTSMATLGGATDVISDVYNSNFNPDYKELEYQTTIELAKIAGVDIPEKINSTPRLEMSIDDVKELVKLREEVKDVLGKETYRTYFKDKERDFFRKNPEERTALSAVAADFMDSAQAFKEMADVVGLTTRIQDINSVGDFGDWAWNTIVQLGSQVGLNAATGGGYLFAQGMSETYYGALEKAAEEYKEKTGEDLTMQEILDLSSAEMVGSSVTTGILMGILEKFGLDKIVKKNPLALKTLTESGTEFFQEWLQKIGEKVGLDRSFKDVGEVIRDPENLIQSLEAAGAGAFGAGAFGALSNQRRTSDDLKINTVAANESLADKIRNKVARKPEGGKYKVGNSFKTRKEINDIIENATTAADLESIVVMDDKGIEDKLIRKYNQLTDAIQEQKTRDIPDAERAEGAPEVEEEVREPSIQEKRQEIEQRRQEELEPVRTAIATSEQTGESPVVDGELVNDETLSNINAKYDAELDALQETRPREEASKVSDALGSTVFVDDKKGTLKIDETEGAGKKVIFESEDGTQIRDIGDIDVIGNRPIGDFNLKQEIGTTQEQAAPRAEGETVINTEGDVVTSPEGVQEGPQRPATFLRERRDGTIVVIDERGLQRSVKGEKAQQFKMRFPNAKKGDQVRFQLPKFEVSKEGKGDPSISVRNKVIQEAAEKLKNGEISNEEYRATVSENSPITPITRFFEPATDQQMERALGGKADKLNDEIEAGTIVGSRLDIPAYKNNNTWVVSIHDGNTAGGKVLSYRNVAKLKNVNFGTFPKAALNIAAGKPKTTIARMFGEWVPYKGKTSEERAKAAKDELKDIVNSDRWVQVGMNPFRHSYFYDRSKDMGRPINSASEVVQIGGLVYAKDPVYGNWTDESFIVKGLFDSKGEPVRFQLSEDLETKPQDVGKLKTLARQQRAKTEPKKTLESSKDFDIFTTRNNIQMSRGLKGVVRNIKGLRSINLENVKVPLLKDPVSLVIGNPNVGISMGELLNYYRRSLLSAKKFFTKDLFRAGELKDAFIAKQASIVEQNISRLNRKMKEIKSTAEDLVELDLFMRGLPNKLNEALVPLATEMRSQIDKLSETLIANGWVAESREYVIEEISNDSGEYFAIDTGTGNRVKLSQAQINQLESNGKAPIEGETVNILSSVKDNLGEYLTRSYKIFDDKNWRDKVGTVIVQRAKNLYREQLRSVAERVQPRATKDRMRSELLSQYTNDDGTIREQELTQAVENEYSKLTPSQISEEINTTLERMVDNKIDEILGTSEEKSFMKKGKMGSKDLSILKERKDIPLEIRMLMGEYTDPLQNYARTILKQASLVANQRFLETSRQMGMGKFFFEPGQPRPRGFDFQIAAEGSETMSPLNGLYTTKEIFEQFSQAADSMPKWLEPWMKTISVVKWMKTIGSFTTHIKNFTGNFGFMAANGHWDLREMGGAYKIIKNDLLSKTDVELNEMMNEYIEAGLVKQSAGLNEIRAMFKDANFDEATERILSKKPSKLGKVKKFLEDLYGSTDDMFKIVAYENEMSRYSRAIYGKDKSQLTEAERSSLKEEVADIVKNTYPTYSRVPELIQMIRRFPAVGNFVSFQAESWRTAYNIINIASKEIKSDNPAIKKIGFQRLAGVVAYTSIKDAIVSYSSYSAGMGLSGLLGALFDDDEEKEKDRALRRYVADWSKNSDLVILESKDGNLRYIDVSASDPFGGIAKVFNAFANGEDIMDSTLDGLYAAIEPFIGTDIATNTFLQIKNNDNGYGGRIYNPEDPSAFNKALQKVIKTFQPGTAASVRRFIDAENKLEEASAQLLGLRTYTNDLNQSFTFKLTGEDGYRQRIRDAKSLSRERYDKNATLPEVLEGEERKKQALKLVYADLTEDFVAAIKLGVSPLELIKKMKDLGLSREDIVNVIVSSSED